ncbi:hypothetical protein EVAR_19373_1 [Eumeta japonica]|uniref:Uncharacterized protein n=1 Tax=Eumeta variegata TaxID=151549 RepID=A0A4C1TRH2_EUMVA|nr:hypothetical protein EVAR_19373_1 [Eumeta japonica]
MAIYRNSAVQVQPQDDEPGSSEDPADRSRRRRHLYARGGVWTPGRNSLSEKLLKISHSGVIFPLHVVCISQHIQGVFEIDGKRLSGYFLIGEIDLHVTFHEQPLLRRNVMIR